MTPLTSYYYENIKFINRKKTETQGSLHPLPKKYAFGIRSDSSQTLSCFVYLTKLFNKYKISPCKLNYFPG